MLTFLQERNNWLDALNSAIKATSPHRHYKLGDAAPVWVPDTRVTMCHAFVNRSTNCAGSCGIPWSSSDSRQDRQGEQNCLKMGVSARMWRR